MDALNNMINNELYIKALHGIADCIETEKSSFLITGATGLIGSVIIDLLMLSNRGGKRNHVFALGRSKEKLKKRFSDYLNEETFHIIEQDICKSLDESVHFDYIIHGASNADPVAYAKYPAETMITNIMGTHNVLEYGRKYPTCRIVVLSTFEVYGNASKDVYRETDTGIIDFNGLRACYPESKRSVELLSCCYFDEYGVNVSIARLSSIYGPTMADNDSKAHAQFLRKALLRKDIVLKSNGEQKMTYTYVLDAVSAILTVLFRGASNECYNVSNEKSIASIAQVAHEVAAIAGQKVVFDVPTDLEAKGFSKPQNCILDNTKLKQLGWTGKYALHEGLKECMDVLSIDAKKHLNQ